MRRIILSYLKKLANIKNLSRLLIFFFIINEKKRLFSLIFFKKSQIISFKYNGKIVRLSVRDIVDLAIIFEIFVSKIYPMEESNSEEVIFDVGAHSGFFTIYAKTFMPNAIVYLFEPEPSSFKNLEKNLALNNLDHDLKTKIYNFGLSDINQEATFYRNKSSAYSSLFKRNDSSISIKVHLKSLVNFLDENKIKSIDLLKIDIEGGEYDLLLRLDHKRFKDIGKLFVEIHKIEDKNRVGLVDLLKNNFKMFRQRGIVFYFYQ